MKRKLFVLALVLTALGAFAFWWNEEYGWTGPLLEGRRDSAWIEELKDEDPATRIRSAEALAVLPANIPGVVSALVERLSDADAGVRTTAVWTLGELPGPAEEALDDVGRMLLDPETRVRREAARALLHITGSGDQASRRRATYVLRALTSPDEEVARDAAWLFRKDLSADGLGVREALLTHPEPLVRRRLAAILYGGFFAKSTAMPAPAPQELPTLLAALDDTDAEVRRTITEALVRVDESAVSTLVAALREAQSEKRRVLLNILRSMGSKARVALPVVSTLLQNAGSDRDALWTLLAFDPKSPLAREPLRAILREGVPAERLRAVQALAFQSDGVPALLDVLSDADPELRYEALGSLRQHGPDARPALPALVALGLSEDARTRNAAVEAIAAMGSIAVPRLLESAGTADRRASAFALAALGRMGSSLGPTLLAQVQDSNPQVRVRLAEILGGMAASKEVMLALARLLADSDAEVRKAVGPATLRLLNSPTASQIQYSEAEVKPLLPPLMKLLRDPSAPRRAIVGVLGRFGPAGVHLVPIVIRCFKDERDVAVRREMTYLVRRLALGDQSTLAFWLDALRDPDAGVAMNASHPLAALKESAIPGLKEALASKQAHTRSLAATGLGLAGSSVLATVLPSLETAAATDEHSSVRAAALGALARLKPEHPLVTKALQAGDYMTKLNVVSALMYLGPKAEPCVAGLAAIVKDPSSSLRQIAATALGNIGPPAKDAIGALRDLLFDSDPSSGSAAATALVLIGQDSLPALQAGVEHESWEVRQRVLSGLAAQNPIPLWTAPLVRSGARDSNPNVQQAAQNIMLRMRPQRP